MKKFLTTLLAIGLVIAMPIAAVAAAFTLLHQPVPIEWSSYKNEKDSVISPEVPHLEDSNDVFWHFIANQLTDEQSPILKATITFKNSEGKEYIITLNSYKSLNKMNHYGIYTPYDFILIKASVNSEIAGKFNLSHVYGTTTTTPTSETTKETTKQTTKETTPTTTSTTTETTPTTTQTTTKETTTTEGTTTQVTTTTQTSGTTVESSTSITTVTTTGSTTPITTDEIPKTGETEDFQMITIGIVMLALAGALAIWKKRLSVAE